MTEHEQELQEIARDELWLHSVLSEAESLQTERIKMRIRLEAGERWLSDRLHDPSTPHVADAARLRVHLALHDAAASAAPPRPLRTLRTLSTLRILRPLRTLRTLLTFRTPYPGAAAAAGLAAALAIAVFALGRIDTAGKKTTPASTDERIGETDLVALSAFDLSGQEVEEVDQSLQTLEKEIADLGRLFAGRGGDGDTNNFFDDSWDSLDSSGLDGDGADQPVGAVWRLRESGV